MNNKLNEQSYVCETPLKEITPTQQARELLTIFEAGAGVNFQYTNNLALECVDEVLENWLPEGEHRGRQYVAYNPHRNDDRLGSFQVNKENGLWKDFSTGEGGSDLVSLISFVEDGITQTDAAIKFLRFIAGFESAREAALTSRIEKAKESPKSQLTPIFPVPKYAGQPPVFFGPRLGAVKMCWEYKSETGDLLCLVCRFQTESGKTYLPVTWCKDESGFENWRTKAPSSNKPLYGLDRLATRRDAAVIITEGEKAADAAQRLFPSFVAVTTMGGAQAPEKADLAPLAGRDVYIARDNDDAGLTYQNKIIELLGLAGANVRAVMNIDLLAKNGATLTSGYDLADAEADGWNDMDLGQLEKSIWNEIRQKDKIDALTQPSDNKLPLQNIRDLDSSKISDLEFAQLFAKNYKDKIITIEERVLAYEEGYWRPLDPNVEIKRPLLELIGVSAKTKRINSIYELIRIKTAEPIKDSLDKSPMICLKNGTLDPMNRVLREHSAENYLTNKLDIDYLPESACPLWIQTLEEIFGCDDDCNEKIALVQEFLGYSLIPDTRHAKFIWMVGAGGNGKSVILSIFSALVGKHNISFAQIERLERPAVRAELQNKLLNISSEMSANATLSDSYLKQIVAGEMIEAERKFERPFSFKATARLVAATNTLPRLLDHSDGFARRAIILRFNRQFKESERDINRESKLMKELPGILNWALEGLNRLQARGRFISPKSSINELAQYRLDSDPIKLFAEDYLVAADDKGTWIRSSLLYANYKEWSTTNGYNPLSAGQFGKRLEEMGFKKIRSSHGIDWKAKYEDKTSQLRQASQSTTSTEQQAGIEKFSDKYNV